ncbi:DUF4880 domain-containing protein [Acidovorax sp. SUPP3334]|uniref:DUF4880 domain-containing protein n=1 Tax=Acidovorax sp. SUPP3334 TaxID=2920881 RepID=UPI0023DE258E|nr:DUF4880 domain-containing protein [Acidovorax sp. SUPP3334]GKT25816.1 DUF4880 domain-containing protein [Acidovorax sp. SUPP3334]
MRQADPHWAVAWDWVQREHDREHFDAAAREEMTRWLADDPEHRKAYDKAARLWLLAGLVAPLNDVGDVVQDRDPPGTAD